MTVIFSLWLRGGKTTGRYPGLASSFVHIDYFLMAWIDGWNESRIMARIALYISIFTLYVFDV